MDPQTLRSEFVPAALALSGFATHPALMSDDRLVWRLPSRATQFSQSVPNFDLLIGTAAARDYVSKTFYGPR